MVPCHCQASSYTGQHQSHLPLLPPQAFSYDGRNQSVGGGREGEGKEREV